jgi:membrane protein YqaA with SNARE-associated domain
MLIKILTVAALATFEMYAAIPAGFAFGLSPWIIFFASLTGGLAGIFISAFLGDRIKKLFARYRKNPAVQREQKTDTLAHRIWTKFGVAGLGFLGTVLVGAPVSIGVGTGLNVPLKKLVTWCCIGVVTRCIVFTMAGHYGLKLL